MQPAVIDVVVSAHRQQIIRIATLTAGHAHEAHHLDLLVGGEVVPLGLKAVSYTHLDVYKRQVWTLPAAALGMICLAYVTSPAHRAPAAAPVAAVEQPASTTPAKVEQASPAAAPVEQAASTDGTPAANAGASDFAQVESVIHERCTVCHLSLIHI